MYKSKINITKLYIICKRQLPIIIYISIFIFLCIIYIVVNGSHTYNINFTLLFILIYFEILLITTVNFILFYQIRSIIKRQKTRKKKKFHRQIISLFAIVTMMPTLFVFVFAVVFFNIGIESLFKRPIKDVIDNNNAVIDNYLQDIHLILKNYTNNLTSTICKYIDGSTIDIERINEILNNEASNNKIDAIVFQIYNKGINIIAKSAFALSIQHMLPNQNIMIPMNNIISYEVNNFIVSLNKIDEESNIFLAVASPIDQTIVDYRSKIKQASNQYIVLLQKHSGIKITFLMLFFIITVMLLLLSIFGGLIISNRILTPVNKLIMATDNISCGNYTTMFEVKKINNEWDELLLAFNNMINQLEHQKQQLTIYSKQTAWRDLARKIAHEVKNPLTPILLSAERIQDKYRDEIVTSPEIFDMCINTITRQVNCISHLIKEFSDFARMPAPVIENNDIINLLKEVIFLQSNSNPNIEFKSILCSNELICKFDITQINQVLINIIQNAINSIKESNINNNKLLQSNNPNMYENTVSQTNEPTINNNKILQNNGPNINNNNHELLPTNKQNISNNKVSQTNKSNTSNNNEMLQTSESNTNSNKVIQNNESDTDGNEMSQNNEMNSNNNEILQTIGTILVKCYIQNNKVFITIEDSGPGFSETALKKAFEPYFTTRKSGNGLGLAIVYKIINDHGGDINIGISNTLGGAKVSISIPYVK